MAIKKQITFEGLTYNLDDRDRVAAQTALKETGVATNYVQPVVNITSSTYAPTKAQSGTIFTLNLAAGITITLPAAEAGLIYEFHVGTTFTGDSWIINAASSADTLQGGILFYDVTDLGSMTKLSEGVDTIAWAQPAAADHQLVVDASTTTLTKGGNLGSHIKYQCITDALWYVSGQMIGDGTLVTPFT